MLIVNAKALRCANGFGLCKSEWLFKALVKSSPTSHPLDREIGLFWNSLVSGEVIGLPLAASDAGVSRRRFTALIGGLDEDWQSIS